MGFRSPVTIAYSCRSNGMDECTRASLTPVWSLKRIAIVGHSLAGCLRCFHVSKPLEGSREIRRFHNCALSLL
jgi:hypothetical protein